MHEPPPPKQPGEIEIDRRVLIAILAAVLLFIVAIMALDSRPAGAPAPSPAPTFTPPPPTVPVTARTSRGCPSGWSGFVNTAYGYELCRPNPWRFVEDRETTDRLLVSGLNEVRMVTAAALPWVSGADPLRVVLERNSLDVRIVAGAAARGCEPTEPLGDARSCSFRAKRDLRPDDRGEYQVMLASIAPSFPGDAPLFVVAVTTVVRAAQYRLLVERFVARVQRAPSRSSL